MDGVSKCAEVGLAAQNTPGNLVAGLLLAPYRSFRVGDVVEINTPKGVTPARVQAISPGHSSHNVYYGKYQR